MALPSQSPGFPVPSQASGQSVTRPSWIQVTWGAGGSTDRWSLEMARRIQSGDLPFQSEAAANRKSNGNGHVEAGLPTHAPEESEGEVEDNEAGGPNSVDALLHLTCTNVTLDSLRNTLRSARKAGVRNILALRGDPPRGQEYWVAADSRFQHAADLVRFIREEHGDYFCIGVAGYPEGHPDDALLANSLGGEEHSEGGPEGSKDIADPVERDIRNLLQKQAAGAEFVITQLFYNAEAFLNWERRAYAAGLKIPIVPGIMPIINYQSFRRMTTLCKVRVPDNIFNDLQQIKGDDAQVRTYGVEVAKSIIRRIWLDKQSRVKGFHLCTLNLEKSVSRIIAELDWWCPGRRGRSVDAEAQEVRDLRAEQGLQTRQHLRNQKIQTDVSTVVNV
jgi:methylenetetrahydrofolate reductase (NADPH)